MGTLLMLIGTALGQTVTVDQPGGYDTTESATVSWADMTSSTPEAWVGLAASGSPLEEYSYWYNVGDGDNGNVVFDHLPADSLVARYFPTDTTDVLGGESPSFDVTHPGNPPATVAAATSTLTVGGDELFDYANASGFVDDWVGIYRQGDADDQYLAFAYTGGAYDGTIDFADMAGPVTTLPIGTFDVRLFERDSYTMLAQSSYTRDHSAAMTSTFTTDKSSYLPSEPIVVDYDYGGGCNLDWIGARDILSNRADGTAWQMWSYMEPGEEWSGSLSLPALLPGAYRIEYLAIDSYDLVARTTGPAFTPSKIITVDFGVDTSPAPMGSLTTTQPNYGAGEDVGVNWSGMTSDPGDWVALIPDGEPDTSMRAFAYTGAVAAGSHTFVDVVLGGGNYLAKFFTADSYSELASVSFTVSPSGTPDVDVTPALASQFDPLDISYSGMPAVADGWIGVVAQDASWWQWPLGWARLPTTDDLANPSAAGTIPAGTFPDGGYELRIYDGEDTVLAYADFQVQSIEGDCDDGLDNDGDSDTDCADSDCTSAPACQTPLTHCGNITSDETWDAAQYHIITCNVYVQGGATVTIDDGAVVKFNPTWNIMVGWSSAGDLVVDGSPAGDGVLFTSNAGSPAAGDWGSIRLGQYTSAATVFNAATLEYGGDQNYAPVFGYRGDVSFHDGLIKDSADSCIALDAGQTLHMTNSTLDGCAIDGVELHQNASLYDPGGGLPSFVGNSVLNAAGYAMAIPTSSATYLGATNLLSGNGTDRVLLLGTALTGTHHWRDPGIPYQLVYWLDVGSGGFAADWIVDDGVEIYVNTSYDISVGTSGSATVDINGSTLGVRMDATGSTWEGLLFTTQTDAAASDVDGLIVSKGGGNGNDDKAALQMYGYSGVLDIDDCTILDSNASGIEVYKATASIQGCTISNSDDYGVHLYDQDSYLDFAAPFDNNTITGSGKNPVQAFAGSLGALGTTSAYTGNTIDTVEVVGGNVRDVQTWSALDVPYEITAHTYVFDNGAQDAELTLADGVEIMVRSPAAFTIAYAGADGALIVNGTSTGVAMKSAESSPAPGDWTGLVFSSSATLDDSNLIGLEIAHSGANVNADAAITTGGSGVLATDDLWLHDGLGDGIYIKNGTAVAVSNSLIEDFTMWGIRPDGTTSHQALRTLTGTTLRNNTLGAVLANPIGTHSLGTGNVATGNGVNAVQVRNGPTVTQTTTWTALGIPYVLDLDFLIASSGSPPTLAVEAGAVVYMKAGRGITLGTDADLVVTGANGNPAIFESDLGSPAAGDWDGIRADANSNGVNIDWAEIRHASRDDASYPGAVSVFGGGGAISNTVFDDIAGYCVSANSPEPTLTANSYVSCTDGDKDW